MSASREIQRYFQPNLNMTKASDIQVPKTPDFPNTFANASEASMTFSSALLVVLESTPW